MFWWRVWFLGYSRCGNDNDFRIATRRSASSVILIHASTVVIVPSSFVVVKLSIFPHMIVWWSLWSCSGVGGWCLRRSLQTKFVIGPRNIGVSVASITWRSSANVL